MSREAGVSGELDALLALLAMPCDLEIIPVDPKDMSQRERDERILRMRFRIAPKPGSR